MGKVRLCKIFYCILASGKANINAKNVILFLLKLKIFLQIKFFSIFTVSLPMTTVEEPLLDDSTDHAKIYSGEVSSKNHIKSQSNERLL